MRIGELARATGTAIDTIRFYERRGLLQPSGRLPSGYRVYGPEAVSRLRFIVRAKELGFTLAEIAELLSLESDDRASAAAVRSLAERRLRDIEARIRSLQRMRRALARVADGCPGQGPARRCSILRTLAGGSP